MMRIFIIAFFLLCAMPVQAKEWVIDYDQSHITFTGTQGSEKFTGGFKKFQTNINFDPAKPAEGKITATIDIGSAFAGSAERDNALPQPDWFDSSKFPKAEFVSTSIQTAPAPPAMGTTQCFEVSGDLTIKVISKPIALPFCLTSTGDHTHATGTITLLRNDFGIGQGQWADPVFVKNSVDVVLEVSAR
jgi:polyisoprenoid-binding protein YceI